MLALPFIAASYTLSDPMARMVAGAMAGTLALVAAVLMAAHMARRVGRPDDRELAARVTRNDPAPCFLTDGAGHLIYRNPAALNRFGKIPQETVPRAIAGLFANPGPVIHRLQATADLHTAAREDIVTRRGQARISVHQFGADGYLWRLEEMEGTGATKASDNLSVPVVTVGRNQTILFMNEAARTLFGGRVKSLSDILSTASRRGDTVQLNGAEGPVTLRLLELATRNGRREVYFLPAGPDLPVVEPDNQVFDILPVALVRLTTGGRVLLMNRLARGLLACDAPDQRLADLIEGPGKAVSDWLSEVVEGRMVHRAEVVRVKRADKEMYLSVALQPVAGPDSTDLIAVLHDATELKTLEAQFVQGQKMQAIGQLAGGIAHDFNNLLTAISGHCDLLLLRHDSGDPDFADLMQISQNSNRAASLVGQLLAFSRKQTLQLKPVDLYETLADLTHLLNRLVGERTALSVSHAPDLAPIRADRRQLEQVIMNLAVNARDAMNGTGKINIETAMHHLKEELHRDRAVVPPGDYVLVRVSDNGHGIPPEKLNAIFEPFFTTKKIGEGTGLGLSMVYGIVKQTGGFIFVDSALGSGTCFTLYFPALPRTAATEGTEDAVAKTPIPPAPEEPVEGVVLLVEDEAPVRAFAARALRMRGFTVLDVENAEEALKVLEDRDLTVDIFLTDVVMPGLDGPGWVKSALRDRPETRVVFVSGYAEDTFAEVQAEIANSVFLPKPFSLIELTSTVQGQLKPPELTG